MKNLLIILICLFSASSVCAQSGKPLFGSSKSKTEAEKAYEKLPWQEQSSGFLLQQASKDLVLSGGLFLGAGALCGIGVVMDDDDARLAMLVSGAAIGAISVYFGFKGYVTLGRAGKVLDKNRSVAYMKPANQGVGINITF